MCNIFSTAIPRQFNRERSVFNKCSWDDWKSTCNEIELPPHIIKNTKILTQNGSINLIPRPKTYKTFY